MSFLTLHKIHHDIMQAMQLGRKLSLVNLSVFFLIAAFNVFFIVVVKLGATGMLLAHFLVHVGLFFYMIYDLKKQIYCIFAVVIILLWHSFIYRDSLQYIN